MTTASDDDMDELDFDRQWECGLPVDVLISPGVAAPLARSGAEASSPELWERWDADTGRWLPCDSLLSNGLVRWRR